MALGSGLSTSVLYNGSVLLVLGREGGLKYSDLSLPFDSLK